MQTFLPYANYVKSAKVLDRQRLGKQRVEAYQILRTLLGISTGWRQHPAVRMWIGYEWWLHKYTELCIAEWVRQGYKNNIVLPDVPTVNVDVPPWWWNDKRLTDSHKGNLLRKMPQHYGQFGWDVDPAAPYWWPSHEVGRGKYGKAPAT